MKIINCEQYGDEWWEIRNGKPTASNAKKLITSQGKESKSMLDYATELAGDLYAGKQLNNITSNEWMERGTELEDSARSLYELINDCEVEEVGMVVDDDDLFIASPDGIVSGNSILEIKCLKPTNHIKAHMYYKKMNKAPTDYISQVQMQLFVSGFDYADLMFFNEDLPELIIRIEADKDFHKVLEQQLHAVIKERDNIIKLLKEA